MRYKLLGPSGLRVSEICLGTMSFGEAWGFGADEKESHRILGAYAEAGGNFIDTANKYHEGQSEEIVGASWAPSATAGWWRRSTRWPCAPATRTRPGTRARTCGESVEASLRRLRTDYLDMLWVHAWDFTTPVEEVMRGLDDLVSAPARSTTSPCPTRRRGSRRRPTRWPTLRGWSPFVALQVEYSLHRAHAPSASSCRWPRRSACRSPPGRRWAPASSPASTPAAPRACPRTSKRADGQPGRLTERNLEIAREVDRVADELGATSAQVAIAWLRTAQPADDPGRRRAHRRAARRRPRQPRRRAAGRAAPAWTREPDRARVPVQPAARAPGTDGLRRPRTAHRPAPRGAVPLAGSWLEIPRRPMSGPLWPAGRGMRVWVGQRDNPAQA